MGVMLSIMTLVIAAKVTVRDPSTALGPEGPHWLRMTPRPCHPERDTEQREGEQPKDLSFRRAELVIGVLGFV